ncbi:serine hydrolase domain-containing protein [Phytomonospora sp. NPDC050363]|uniref:serine hydrolase domain-containing protein n=1 Tax=Phytomonospora sp. NPDC050363 TaxID=3155642 RepID=UPI0033C210F2
MRLQRIGAVALAFALVTLVPAPAAADPAGTLRDELDAVVTDGSPSAVLEFRDGRHVERLAGGVAELGRQRPAPVNGRFRIGSVTKTFSSTVALQLVGEGRISLDDSVERRLPGVVPNGRNITLRQLLNHTSGLYNYTDDVLVTPEQVVRDRYKRWTPQQLVALATSRDPLFPPGTAWSYSNTNYVLIGLVIEQVTGHPLQTEVDRRIIRPLGLRDTEVPRNSVRISGPHAHGYLQVNGEPVDITALNVSSSYAVGDIISTTRDLNTFYAALLGGRLLKPAQLTEMKTTAFDSGYGLGLSKVALPCGTEIWGHTGGIPGYLTFSFHQPETGRYLSLSATSYAMVPDVALFNVLTAAFCPSGTPGGTPDLLLDIA